MIGYKVTVSQSGKLRALLEHGPALLMPFIVAAMEVVGQGLERSVKADKLSGQALAVRTGNLRRAIFHRVGEVKNAVEAYAVVGADARKALYGRIHEYGGTITPKRGRYLTIPIGKAKTPRGVARFSARDLRHNPRAFGYTGSFVAKNVIFGTKKNWQPEPLFALKTSVRIKAVGYLRSTVQEKRPWARDVIEKAAMKGVREIFG